jgi:hypothetical protein
MPTLPEFLAWVPPTPAWLLPGLIPTGRTIIVGRPKAGKTFLSVQIAESLSTGRPLVGRWAPTRTWRVLYVHLDEPSHVFHEQLTKMRATGTYVLTWWDCARSHPDWVPRYPLEGVGPLRLAAVIAAHQPEVLIIDGLTYLAAELDQNEARGVKQLYVRLARIWSGPQILLAHANKTAAQGEGRHPIERVKGATELTADADGYVFVESRDNVGTWHIGGRLLSETSLAMHRVPMHQPGEGRWVPPRDLDL